MNKIIARLTVSPQQFSRLIHEEKTLLESAGFTYSCHHHKKGEIPHASVRDAHVIIPNTSYPVDGKIMDYFPNLEHILVPNSGYDHIDTQAARQRGISWQHLPWPRAIDVCESAIMMILDLLRRSPYIYQSMQSGHWMRDAVERTGRLYKRHVGLVGFGMIGQRMSKLLKPFEPASIRVYDPHLRNEIFDSYRDIEPVQTLDALFASCQIISVHCSLTPSSHQMINQTALGSLQSGSYLINTARGKVVVEAAIAQALESGKLAGFATDVFQDEPLPAEHWLRNHPKVLCTPHIAGYSFEMLQQLVINERDALLEWASRR